MTMVATETKADCPMPGFYRGTTFADYVSWKAINWHTLEPFRKSAKHGHHVLATRPDSTKAQEKGDAFHAAILEPHRLDSEYAVMPDFPGHHNSKAYREAKQQWENEHATQAVITAQEHENFQAMIGAVRAHPIAGPIMAGKGVNEVGIVWRMKDGTLCKGRCDTIRYARAGLIDLAAQNPDARIVVMPDLKSTACTVKSNRPLIEAFPLEAARLGIHGQLAFYIDGLKAIRPGVEFVPLIIAVENVPPFDVCVFDMRPMMDAGRFLYRQLMKRMQDGLRTGRWAGCCDLLIPMFPQPWQETEEESDNAN